MITLKKISIIHDLNIKSIDIYTCQSLSWWFKFLQLMLCTKKKPINEEINTSILVYKKKIDNKIKIKK